MKMVRDLIGTTEDRRSERRGKMSAEAEAAPSRSPISRRWRRSASSSSSSFRSLRWLLNGEGFTASGLGGWGTGRDQYMSCGAPYMSAGAVYMSCGAYMSALAFGG